MGEPLSLTRGHVLTVWIVAGLCAILPFGYHFWIQLSPGDNKSGYLYIGNFSANAIFYVLALLPGAAAIMHYVVSRSSRNTEAFAEISRFRCIYQNYLIACGAATEKAAEDPDRAKRIEAERAEARTRGLISAVASALLLTSVLLLVAALADQYGVKWDQPKESYKAIQGLIFAGLGAYVSVVYYMIGRMYANALSSRFVSASALKTAFALGLGYAAAAAGIENLLPGQKTAPVALVMLGLFQSAAYTAIRNRANTWLGAAKPENEELPLDSIQGIDDTTVDLLREYGVATIQQLAESDLADLSKRTLVPIATLADWADQAILIVDLQRKISVTRPLGIRCASDLARAYLMKDPVVATVGQKTELDGNVNFLAVKLLNKASVRAVFEFLRGMKLETFLTTQTEFDTRFDARLNASFDTRVDQRLQQKWWITDGSSNPRTDTLLSLKP